MSDTIFLGWISLFLGLAVTFSSNPTTTQRDVTLVRLIAGVALIVFGLLRLLHVI